MRETLWNWMQDGEEEEEERDEQAEPNDVKFNGIQVTVCVTTT